jgi:hypothetical protein
VFVRDRRTRTRRAAVSISTACNQANNDSGAVFEAFESATSPRGLFVAVASDAINLVQSDTNDATDLFVRGPLTP